MIVMTDDHFNLSAQTLVRDLNAKSPTKPVGLRHELSSLARTLWSWVRIPRRAWRFGVCVFIVFVVLYLRKGLATGRSLVQWVLPIVYRSKEKIKTSTQYEYGIRGMDKKISDETAPWVQTLLETRGQARTDTVLGAQATRFTCKWWTVKVKLSLCLTNWALRHEGVWGSGCIDPHFLDLGTSWRWVVSFTPRPLYPCGEPRYLLDWRLGRPQSRSGRHGKEKILDPTSTRTTTPPSSSP
jgi:hypothetical protein